MIRIQRIPWLGRQGVKIGRTIGERATNEQKWRARCSYRWEVRTWPRRTMHGVDSSRTRVFLLASSHRSLANGITRTQWHSDYVIAFPLVDSTSRGPLFLPSSLSSSVFLHTHTHSLCFAREGCWSIILQRQMTRSTRGEQRVGTRRLVERVVCESVRSARSTCGTNFGWWLVEFSEIVWKSCFNVDGDLPLGVTCVQRVLADWSLGFHAWTIISSLGLFMRFPRNWNN